MKRKRFLKNADERWWGLPLAQRIAVACILSATGLFGVLGLRCTFDATYWSWFHIWDHPGLLLPLVLFLLLWMLGVWLLIRKPKET